MCVRELQVVLEVGKQKVFASAIDWSGWPRAGKKTSEAAIDELLAYRERYHEVLRPAGIAAILNPGDRVDEIDTLEGTGVTDFGVPDAVHAIEHRSMDDEECARQLTVLRAIWKYFDDSAVKVSPELRKDPRGGGRDRDKIIDHVIQADRSYARHIGVRTPPFDTLSGCGPCAPRGGLRRHSGTPLT